MADPRPVTVTADVTRPTSSQKCFNLPQGKTGGPVNLNSTEARFLAASAPQNFSGLKPVFQGVGWVSSPVNPPVLGTVLTAKPGTILSKPAATLTYQWTRDGVDIATATAVTYTAAAGDVTKSVACKVTATNASGATVSTLTGIRVQ